MVLFAIRLVVVSANVFTDPLLLLYHSVTSYFHGNNPFIGGRRTLICDNYFYR